MAKFKTKGGKEYTVEITIGQLKALRRDCGIDLRDALKPGADSLAEAIGDPNKFGQMMWILCGDQVEKAGLTPEMFVDEFNGDVFRDATAAIWEAIMTFYQGPTSGEKAGRAMKTGLEKADEKLGEVWERCENSLISKFSAGNSAASFESTPAPSA